MDEVAQPAPQATVTRLHLRTTGNVWPRHREARVELPKKAAALLALLSLDGAAARERIAALLWPDAEGDKPRVNLRGLLRDLRRRVEMDLVVGAETLSLAPGLIHDLFDQPAMDTPGLLLDALSFTELDEFSSWLAHWREKLLARHKRDLLARTSLHEAAGQFAPAVASASSLVALDPLDEASHRTLMRQLYLRDDRAEALRAFERCREMLRQSLDVLPSQPTRALATLIELGQSLRVHSSRAPAVQRSLPLLPRDGELQAIDDAWQRGDSVLLEGEAGSGKTVVLESVQARRSASLVVKAMTGDDEVPFALLTRLLRALLETAPLPHASAPEDAAELARLVPELGAPPSHAASTPRLIEALAHLLQGWQQSGVSALLVDDLHWADRASLQLLLPALSRCPKLRSLLSCRSGGRPQELASALDAMPTRWSVQRLRPLETKEIERLLRAAVPALPDPPAWAAMLHERTLGNPMQVVETLRALAQSPGLALAQAAPPKADALAVPATLEALVQARLSRLSGGVLQLAQLAATAGALFSAKLAGAVLGRSELELAGDWAALQADEVFGDESLAHDSMREPLRASVPAALARELHGRIARAAAAQSAAPAELARHWFAARDWVQAALALEAAAAAAFSLGARAEELRLWDQAAECHARRSATDAVFDARRSAFDAALEVRALPQAAERVAWLERAARDDAQRLDAALAHARMANMQFRYDEAIPYAEQAVRLAASVPGDARALRSQLMWATALAGTRQLDAACDVLHRSALAVDRLGDLRLRMDHASTLGYVNVLAGRFAEAQAAIVRSIEIGETLQDWNEVTVNCGNLAVALSRRGNNRAALAAALKGLALRERMGESDGVPAAATLQVIGTLESRLGLYGSALQHLSDALAIARCNGVGPLMALVESMLAMLYLDLGQPELASAVLTPWPDGGYHNGRTMRALIEQEIAVRLGRAGAVDIAALRRLGSHESPLLQWTLRLRLSAQMDGPDAAAECGEVAAVAGAAGAVGVELTAWLRHADALRRAGDGAAATAWLRPALCRMPNGQPTDLSIPEAWWIAHQVFLAAGAQDEADAALRSGCDWITHEALPNVPAGFEASFLHDHPIHRELLARSQRPH